MALRNDIDAQIKSDLVGFNSAVDGQAYILLGESVMGDRTARLYYYDVNSTATPDGDNILDSTGMGSVGRYIKQQFEVPTSKRQETYSGTTNSSGNYSVTFGTSFSVAPNIQANIIGGSNTNLIKITSIGTTGFTVNVVNRTDVVGLLPSYSNVNGASVDVVITEK